MNKGKKNENLFQTGEILEKKIGIDFVKQKNQNFSLTEENEEFLEQNNEENEEEQSNKKNEEFLKQNSGENKNGKKIIYNKNENLDFERYNTDELLNNSNSFSKNPKKKVKENLIEDTSLEKLSHLGKVFFLKNSHKIYYSKILTIFSKQLTQKFRV